MAQCKVTDFYAVQKKTSDIQPSKRRKVVRLNEPPILTAKKNRKDFEAPILVVAAGPSSSSLPSANSTEASAQQSDFQPNEKPDINFTNNNNEGEPTVFSAESAKKETVAEEEKPARVTRSRKARDADSASTKASTSKGGRGKRGGRKKKGEDDEKQKDIREALKTPSGTPAAHAEGTAPAAPIEVIGEEATAHENDHELVVTPPSSPSALKEIQQGRKRPKKVSIIVRVSEEEEESEQREKEDEGSPKKLKKVEVDGVVTPKRTPHQMLSPSQMLTPSPRMSGCLPGSIKKLTLSSARKKLNLGGDDAAPTAHTPSLNDASTKNTPILEKARSMMKRLSETVSPASNGDQVSKTSPSETPAESTTPSKGKGKGKGCSNRVEELKKRLKEAKEKSQESSSGSFSSSPSKQGLDSLLSRLGKSNGQKLSTALAAPVVEHGAATQAKSNKLLELQAKLKAIDKQKRALTKDIGGKTAEGKASSAAVETPDIKSVAKEASITKAAAAESKSKRAPAHEKYAYLAEKIEAPNGELPLPHKYKMLLEFFRNTDQAVSLYYNRKEMITFSKLKGAVQELTRRSFDEKHLGQIMTVYPDSYDLRREKAKNLYGMKNLNSYELTIEPRLADTTNCDVRPSMSAADLLNRRHKFHHNLINLLRKQHTKFLESLTPPVRVDETKVQRWHPKFRLEDLPEVSSAVLPKAPEVEKFTTAKEVLDKAKGSMNERIQAALKQMATDKEASTSKDVTKEKGNSSATPNTSSLNASSSSSSSKKAATKGIPPSLLAKIREKEAKKAGENLVMCGEKSERVNQLGRLPDFVKILRTFFLTEKKPALLIEDVVKKVSDSHRSALVGNTVETHIKLIAEVAPEWLTMTKLSSGTYVKINRTMDINKIMDNIEKEKKRTNL